MEKDFSSFFSGSKKVIEHYIRTRIALLRVRMTLSLTNVLSSLLSMILVAFLFMVVLIFMGVTLGFWLSGLLGSYTRGFGVTTLAYILLVLLCLRFRERLFRRPMLNLVAQALHEEPRDQERGVGEPQDQEGPDNHSL